MHFPLLFLASIASATPLLHRSPDAHTRGGISLPLKRRQVTTNAGGSLRKRGTFTGATGLGDFLDLFYTVPIKIGNTDTALNLDTGSSDLWVVSTACSSPDCTDSESIAPYPQAHVQAPVSTAGSILLNLTYGDSLTGTFANGEIGSDSATIATLTMPNQVFGAITDTNNTSVATGASGILGLSFPSGSLIQASVVNSKFGNPQTTDDFVDSTGAYGPLLSRLVMSGALEMPMFAVMLQRNVIDVSGGDGEFTIGMLPDGVDNSSLTWLPVKLYTPSDGGLIPPSSAPDEIYPLRWEIALDGVYLDGKRVDSNNGTKVTALIDTGNSLLRGPEAVVNTVLSTVSPAFAQDNKADPTYPCAIPHTVAFELGGKMFPVDPRDFISQSRDGDATTCVADNIVSTDPPGFGATFSWSFGDPFFKSNLVAFYYGNLTNPSADPPRIGFMSLVPANASQELVRLVDVAQDNGGRFESTSQAAPTFPASLDLPNATIAPAPNAATVGPLVMADPTPPATPTRVQTNQIPTNQVPPDRGQKSSPAAATRVNTLLLLIAALWSVNGNLL